MFDHILIPIYKIIRHVSKKLSDKSNHDKIYDNLYFFNKVDGQIY
jgi:hypothetical protein